MERPLGELRLYAVLIDGTPCKGRQMNVKRWRTSDQIECRIGSPVLVAERQFRKVIGHRKIPLLLSSTANSISEKPIAKGASVA